MALRINTKVPYGNACDVAVHEGRDMTVVEFVADPHGGPETLWFCFRMVRDSPATEKPTPVKLVLKNTPTMLGGGSYDDEKPQHIRPVIRYGDREWDRLGPEEVERHPDGRVDVAWTIPEPTPTMEVAVCYPYGPPDVEAMVNETSGVWRTDTIGASQGGRPLIRLSNAYGKSGSERPGLYLVARQHSGETSGSWTLDGALREFASAGDRAPLVWCVPLSNIDGVEGGDYGKDNFPYDLNRAWGKPAMRHETLVIKQDLNQWKARCQPAMVIDFHSPGLCEAEGFYCLAAGLKKGSPRYKAIKPSVDLFAQALQELYVASRKPSLNPYPTRWITPNLSSYSWDDLQIPGVTLECPYALAGSTVLTREKYQEAGRRLAAALVKHLAS